MAEIVKRSKALAVSPLKASQTTGAALAFLGFNRAMPLMHGSQGCTAFAKVFFVRHFREPIPLQTTAMDQVSSVMGADDNIIEALSVISEKNSPAIIGLVTTGLAETQGADIHGSVAKFQREKPQFKNTHVVAVNSPDFSGCFESGFAAAVKAIIETLVPDSVADNSYHKKVGSRKKQVNVLVHSNLTTGDLEYITESIESFGLRPMLIPDLSGSLDGHLVEDRLTPLTTGGLSVDDLQTAGESVATLVIGASLTAAADSLNKRTGVPDHRFTHLMTMEAVDRWLLTLASIIDQEVSPRWTRQRQQLQDAMLDTHFMISSIRVGIATDPDLLCGFDAMMHSMGAEVVAAVVPAKAASLKKLPLKSVKIGDLEDLEILSRERNAEIIIGNSHAVDSAARLQLPILRAGFPQYDYMGGFQRCWSGYRAIQNTLFELANLLVAHHQDIPAYHSIYSDSSKYIQRSLKEDVREEAAHGH